jgi:hypothetical protein
MAQVSSQPPKTFKPVMFSGPLGGNYEVSELHEGAAAKALPSVLLPSLAAVATACVVAPSADTELVAAPPTDARALTLDIPDFPPSAATLDSRAVMDALNCSPDALTAATAGSLSLPAGTAVMVVVRAAADAFTVAICAPSAALTLLPPDVTAAASPSTFFFRVVVAVHT